MYKIVLQNHKLHHKSHGKLESGIISQRTNPSRGESPKRYLIGRLTLAAVICYSKDAIELYTNKYTRDTNLQNKIKKR